MPHPEPRPYTWDVTESKIRERERQRNQALVHFDTSTQTPKWYHSSRTQALIALLVLAVLFMGLLLWFHLL